MDMNQSYSTIRVLTNDPPPTNGYDHASTTDNPLYQSTEGLTNGEVDTSTNLAYSVSLSSISVNKSMADSHYELSADSHYEMSAADMEYDYVKISNSYNNINDKVTPQYDCVQGTDRDIYDYATTVRTKGSYNEDDEYI